MERRQRMIMQICALALTAALPAQQIAIGSAVPELKVKRWVVRGETPATPQTPRLLCFVPSQRFAYRRAMVTLATLQQQVGTELACIAVLPSAHASALLKLRYGVVQRQPQVIIDSLDGTEAAYTHLFEGKHFGVPTVLLNADGILVWRGALAADIRYLCDDLQSGRLKPNQAVGLHALEELAAIASRSRSWRKPQAKAEQLICELPGQWLPRLVQIEAIPNKRLEDSAKPLWEEAARQLQQRPEYLARILQRVVERSPAVVKDEDFNRAFAYVVLADPKSAVVARACFEYFSARKEDRQATSWAFRWLEAAKADPKHLVEMAQYLGRPNKVARFADVCLMANDLALRAMPADLNLLYAKFELLILHKHDPEGADRVGREIVAGNREDVRFLNSFTWRLLTESPYKQSLSALALHAGETMARVDGWREYWRVDTLALAMFANGRFDDAVVLQRDALTSCDRSSQVRYEQRLERYEKALAARPSKPGK